MPDEAPGCGLACGDRAARRVRHRLHPDRLGGVVTAPARPFGWLFQLAQAASADQAKDIAREALAAGANPANVAAALAEFDRLQDATVLRIGGER